MPKPKRGSALFDLLHGDQAVEAEQLRVPRWWAKGDRAGKVDRPAQVKKKGALSSFGRSGSGLEVEENRPSMDPPVSGRRFIELDGDQVRVSFTSLTLAVSVFLVLIVTLAAFKVGDSRGFERGHLAGRSAYQAQATSAIEEARSRPPATHLLDGLLKETKPPATVGEASAGRDGLRSGEVNWIRDHTYVVVQEFPASASEAARLVREFLKERGVMTELVKYPSGAMQLLTTDGYNLKDPAQRKMAERLRQRVHAIGSDYYASGGGYKLEGYFKTLKRNTW